LFLDGKQITVDNLEDLPANLSQEAINTPVISEELQVFFYQPSPLSSFHPSKFGLNGINFANSEQYFFYRKAEIAKDDASKDAILKATSPQEVKVIGEKIVINPVDWRMECKQVMYEGVKAKFTQNPDLKQFLLHTKKRTLVEASMRDQYWGAGLGLGYFRSKPDTTEWPGANHLGLILMTVRNELAEGDEGINIYIPHVEK